MTREEVMEMAYESGVIGGYEGEPDLLERFAALVAAAEREACAVAAEMVPAQWDYPVEIPHPAQACHDCAAAIRARGPVRKQVANSVWQLGAI
jgi:hypothetical protein